MRRLEGVLKAAVLAGLAWMLYSTISDGTLTYYTNAHFAWLPFVAMMLLAALAMTLVYRLQLIRGAREQGNTPEGDNKAGRLWWGGVAIMAIPVVLGLMVPARPPGVSVIGIRGISLSAPVRPAAEQSTNRAAGAPKNVLDWLREFGTNSDPSVYIGQTVDVTGFIYRDSHNGSDQFWVSRFAISCCVADATAIGMLAQSPQAPSLQVGNWVRVTGQLGVGKYAGQTVPVIHADQITSADQPANPYLNP